MSTWAHVDIHIYSYTQAHSSTRRHTHSGTHGQERTEPVAVTELPASRCSVLAPRAQLPESGGRSGWERDEGDCWSLIKHDAQRQAWKTHCKRRSAELGTPVL